ncbi:helix-turn-helix domain-containing protein [Dyadobacter sp. 676]|uniref:Helix-turn-helix domain-containing protein n=1 Tax=Dyadobacter sp. 676 TaxID=3088362 RepID=A0AAU8FG18_9BACT
MLHTLGLWNTRLFRYFPLAIDLTIQPLLYLYVVSVTGSLSKLRRPAILHLLPSFLLMGHALLVYVRVLPLDDFSEKSKVAAAFAYNAVKEIEDYLSVLSFGIYLFLSISRLRMYRSWLYDTISDSSYPTYGWLRNLLLLIGGLTVLLLANITLDYGTDYGQTNFFHWQLFYFLMTVIIYYIGFQASKQTNLPIQATVTVNKADQIAPVSPEKLPQIRMGIEALLEKERIYRNPTLTLTEMARRLDVSPNALSFTISTSYEKSFRDLINEYRVEEVKEKLVTGRLSHLSILGIALDSGFNSEASFYRVFKKHTNCSPKEFQEQHR